MKKIKRPISRLKRKSNRGFRGFPAATIAFYGPNADRATKIAIFRVAGKGSEPELLDRWFVEDGDVRRDPVSEEKILTLLREHQILSIAKIRRQDTYSQRLFHKAMGPPVPWIIASPLTE